MRTSAKTIVSLLAYLIGVKRESVVNTYGEDGEKALLEYDQKEDTRAIRSLNKIRTALMSNYAEINHGLRYELKNLNTIDYFSAQDIKELEKQGIQIVKANYRADQYLIDVNRYIAEQIEKCKKYFPMWLEWSYIRSLFIIPHSQSYDKLKREMKKYTGSRMLYPYQMYIYWEPQDHGNLLYNDAKFIPILYRMHGSNFDETNKLLNAGEMTKTNIYDFINSHESTVIAVDCENVDLYKLYAVLKNLDQEKLEKIVKIILFDDRHTTNSWTLLRQFTNIKVEHIHIERVVQRKSLVDIKMSVGICTEHYQHGAESFILVSSDSDYWGLISSIDADFLVLVEKEKCGKDIREAMDMHDTTYCYMDDFCSGNIDQFKSMALLCELKKRTRDLIEFNGREALEDIYQSCRIEAGEKEKKQFYDRYVKTLALEVQQDGTFQVKIQE